MERVIFDFDSEKCTGCCACVIACFDEKDIDTEIGQHPFRNAFELEEKSKKGIVFSALSVACMHCDDAPCIMACPSSCLYKDKNSGLTLFDNSYCIGCHSCAMACPFGIPSFNKEGKMVKCDGCIERQKVGLIPACIRVCPSGAITCYKEADYHLVQKEKSLRTLAKEILEQKY